MLPKIEKRIIVVTPPGMKGGEDTMNEEQYNVALMLEQYLSEEQSYNNIVCISVGDLLQREITKKSDFGKRIYESRKKYSYIEDEIVIDLVQKHIEEAEKDKEKHSGWILEGFPRTRLQALALQQMKIIPDKFFMLNIAD
jgi:adenylate kinase